VPHPLYAFRLKLNRAKSHYSVLQDEVAAWLARDPYGVVGEFEPQTPRYVFRFRMFEPVPEHWAVILGDIVHNARSALDHLAWQLVQLGGSEPTFRTMFPILDNPFDWNTKGVDRLKGARPEHVELVESFQPYHRRDLYGWNWLQPAREDPLWILANLDNIDKHRVLNATPMAVQAVGWTPLEVRDLELGKHWSASWELLDDGAELMGISARQTGPNPYVKLDREESVAVSLGYGATMSQTLDAIFDRLGQVFSRFMDEFH
jgi:hypothetical protein